MTAMTVEKIRKMVRDALVWHIQNAINGDEYLMKEVYEQLDDADDFIAAGQELEEIKALIESRKD